ncbi:caspase family protein [Burkholderia ubonensis]|uniref:caspase family protein n=1 Tax=Burkholderia ubonensis TaxID=101571 RepID=UPI000AB636ED|nr:caspase family protein [Burkholderia ubonensis]
MKRKALLIGNTGDLPGVALDLKRMDAFLKSTNGGSWYTNEIVALQNPTRRALDEQITKLRLEGLDYCIVLYSGHGGHCRETLLEINPQGEKITESLLDRLASRQLSIFDCCRVELERVFKASAMDSALESYQFNLGAARRLYEERIMQAIPQHVRLYACAVGECSYDTPNGARYLSALLRAAKLFDNDTLYKTVGLAHNEACSELLASKAQQTPEAYLTKCLTSQQLVLSMNI